MSPEEEIKAAKKHLFYWRVKDYTPHFEIQPTVHAWGGRGKSVELEYRGDTYINNSHGVRCDEFTTDHNGKHILFAGCSITAGTGLNKEETWAHRVYELIKKDEETSGYYNIGIPGGCPSDIMLSQIMKYCRSYGNPDVIFLMLPGTDREYRFLNGAEELRESMFRYYLVLDQYCRSNNIKLYTFTWTQRINGLTTWIHPDWLEYDYLYDSFDTFHKIDEDDLIKDIYEYQISNKDDKKAFLASDDDHPGNMWHYAWSKFIYGRYHEDN